MSRYPDLDKIIYNSADKVFERLNKKIVDFIFKHFKRLFYISIIILIIYITFFK